MTIDSNIVIAYLSGDPDVISFLDSLRPLGGFLFLPTIVESEVLSFSQWSPEELESAIKFLEENFTSVSFNRDIARVVAEIRRTTKIKFPDAVIAATALFMKTPLITRNVQDFKNIPNLKIVTI